MKREFALALLAAFLLLPAAAQAEDAALQRSVSVSASGHAVATPDLAYVNTGVMSESTTVKGAVAANNTTMSRLIDGMKSAGVAPADIQTTSFYVAPRYANNPGNQQPVLNGYTVTNQVRITVRDLKKLGDIMDASIQLGANQMNGISFDVEKAETLRDAARRDAMANAKRRAELYAAAAGAQLGPVLQISEGGGERGPVPYAPMMMKAGGAADSVPVESGSQMLEVSVQVTYGLR